MVEIKVTNSPGPSRTVTFQPNEEQIKVQDDVFRSIREVIADRPEEVIREAIRKRPDPRHSEEFISAIIEELLAKGNNADKDRPVYGPQKASASTDAMECMDIVPFNPSQSVIKQTSDPNLRQALKHSLKISSSVTNHLGPSVDLEEMIRNPNISTGLSNSGNTCWFNCLAQMLYSLPKFRSVLYHCVPVSWLSTPIVNINQEHLLHAELLLGFRRLFADLQFTEMAYIEVGNLLQVVDTLYCQTRSDIPTTIGTQQDATEMLILILEWLGTAFNAALNTLLHPELCIDNTTNNIVVSESTKNAPNSDMAGIDPPGYVWNQATSVGTSTMHSANWNTISTPQSRPNSPIRRTMIPPVDIAQPSTSAVKSQVPSKENVQTEVTKELQQFVDGLKQNFDSIFTATLFSSTISYDNSVTAESETKNCPQFFQMQISYGNIHDALEANTYDTGRNTVSHVQNLYDHLPAAIFMGLSRFVYTTGPTKLHDKFTFPKTLFMDRYLKINAQLVATLREEQQKYRAELATINAQLRGMLQYPYGDGGEARLVDIFETTIQALAFAREKEEPRESVSFSGPLHPSSYNASNRHESKFVDNLGKIFPRFEAADPSCSETLQRLAQNLRDEEERCRNRVIELENLIANVYELDELRKHQYELRAIIVHSGEANRGHYWTYRVKKSIDGYHTWEKLNDQKTDQVDWSQVEADAFGNGTRESPSAYLLMYVRSDARWLDAADELTTGEALATLPNDVQEYVSQRTNEWKEDLRRFREKKAAANAPKETVSSFTWNKKEEQNDENANPTEMAVLLTDRLDEKETSVLSDSDISEVSRITSRFWNTIMKIEPHRFSDEKELLNHHLGHLMSCENGGSSYIERKLGYPIGELREDAENDIERVYTAFITEYADISTNMLSPNNSKFLLFVKMMLEHLNVSVLRYLLVYAMALSSIEVIASRAKSELDGFEQLQYETSQKMKRVAYLFVHIYEMGNIIAWGARYSLETLKSIDTEKRTSEALREQVYLSMVTARTARDCSRVLSNEISSVREISTFFVSFDQQQVCTVMSLMKMLKILFQYLTSQSLKLTDMEFMLTRSERRVKVEEILFEINNAVSRIHCWHRLFEDAGNQRESSENFGSPRENSVDIRNVFTIMHTSFELVSSCPAIDSDHEKFNCITTIRGLLTDFQERDERVPTDLGDFKPFPVEDEMQMMKNLQRDFGSISVKLDKILSDIQEIISNMYG